MLAVHRPVCWPTAMAVDPLNNCQSGDRIAGAVAVDSRVLVATSIGLEDSV